MAAKVALWLLFNMQHKKRTQRIGKSSQQPMPKSGTKFCVFKMPNTVGLLLQLICCEHNNFVVQ